MLTSMWGKDNSYSLLVAIYTGAATMKVSVKISQETMKLGYTL